MGDPDGTTTHGEPAAISLDKGKGKGRAVDKAQPEDVSMGENEESSSDESVLDDHVCFPQPLFIIDILFVPTGTILVPVMG